MGTQRYIHPGFRDSSEKELPRGQSTLIRKALPAALMVGYLPSASTIMYPSPGTPPSGAQSSHQVPDIDPFCRITGPQNLRVRLMLCVKTQLCVSGMLKILCLGMDGQFAMGKHY